MKKALVLCLALLMVLLGMTGCSAKSVVINAGKVGPGLTTSDVEVTMTVGTTVHDDYRVAWYEYVTEDYYRPMEADESFIGGKDYVLRVSYHVETVSAVGDLGVHLSEKCDYAEILSSEEAEGQGNFVTTVFYSHENFSASVFELSLGEIRDGQPLESFSAIDMTLDGAFVGLSGINVTENVDYPTDQVFVPGHTYKFEVTFQLHGDPAEVNYITRDEISPLPLTPIEGEDGYKTLIFYYTVPEGVPSVDDGAPIVIGYTTPAAPVIGGSVSDYQSELTLNGEPAAIYAGYLVKLDGEEEIYEFDFFEAGNCYVEGYTIALPGWGEITVESDYYVEVERFDEIHAGVRVYIPFNDPFIIDVDANLPAAGMKQEEHYFEVLVNGEKADVIAGSLFELETENVDFETFEEGIVYYEFEAIGVYGWGDLILRNAPAGCEVVVKRDNENFIRVEVLYHVTGDVNIRIDTLLPQPGDNVKFFNTGFVFLGSQEERIALRSIDWAMPSGETVFKEGETYYTEVTFWVDNATIDAINAGYKIDARNGFEIDSLTTEKDEYFGKVTVKMHTTVRNYPEDTHLHNFDTMDELTSNTAHCADWRYAVYACPCGAHKIEDMGKGDGEHEADGYNMIDTIWPSCTQDGHVYHDCANCYAYYEEFVPAWGHDYALTDHQDVSCTQNGYDEYTCKLCGDSYRDKETAAYGHNYQRSADSTSATCTTEGHEYFQCTRCPESFEKVTPKDPNKHGENVYRNPFETYVDPDYHQVICEDCGGSSKEAHGSWTYSYSGVDNNGYGFHFKFCGLCKDYYIQESCTYVNGVCIYCGERKIIY